MNAVAHKPKPEPLKVMACKVMMRARLSGAANAVGAILLDHVNWIDFRCDPGIGRLVELTGYSRSNVQNGIDQLVAEGLLVVRVHGGRTGRNSYEFCWDEIRCRDEAMQAALFSGARRTRSQGASLPEVRAQTRVQNPKSEPDDRCAPIVPLSEPDVSKGQARRENIKPWRRALQSPSLREAAGAAALRRWSDDLLNRFKHDLPIYEAAVAAIDEEMQAKITAAEMRRRGGGLQYIVEHLEELLRPNGDTHG